MSCKASLAALRLYGYFRNFCFVFVSENKYDDDDDLNIQSDSSFQCEMIFSPSTACAAILVNKRVCVYLEL